MNSEQTLCFAAAVNLCVFASFSDTLHASSQQSQVNLLPVLIPTVIHSMQANRPSLPPKPPFLSRPLGGVSTPPAFVESIEKSKGAVHSYENVIDVRKFDDLRVEKSSNSIPEATGIHISLISLHGIF